jgi:DNA-binding phage protein
MGYLVETLKKNDCSFAQFALITGLDRTTLYKQLRYGYKPRNETLVIYAKGLSKITALKWQTHLRRMKNEL